MIAAVYGVPDTQAGDQAMAALIFREGAVFDGAAFATWLDGLENIGPKWRPRYLRLAAELPSTGTNKVIKRRLVHEKFRRDRVGDDEMFVRGRGEDVYRAFGSDDESAVRDEIVSAGRERFYDL